ncbi:gastrula zinc finger protein XlCGF8.2DB [Etheostoma spectabile]|uniref:gastrula zinc finger protein XlCGF8.2DB n=1 Tax=Etheostoma spectabile TaxID=54343 RepID=UPI0013AFB570|nr:gastrula zinc finger protein XlCGF8.2DB-like [Etheostoma spectabile]
MERPRRQLEETKLGGEALPPDVLEVIVGEEEKQECNPTVDQQEPKAPPHIKEEQEELWSSQEGEQLQGLEEADNRHTITHTGEKPFRCFVCKKSLTHSGNLQRHMRTHTGEKPFSCSECGKAFADSGNLKKHLITHTGERPFSCSVCKKSFTQSGSLRSHMVVHTGEKSFSCSVCKKSFTRRGGLRKHMPVHTGEKSCCGAYGKDCGGPEPARNSHPLLQPETEDQTGDSSDPETDDSADWKETREPQSALKSRIHDSTCRKKFSCSECGRRFGLKSNLTKHMRIHTGQLLVVKEEVSSQQQECSSSVDQ